MKQLIASFCLLLVLTPSLALGAGFAKGSLFLSKTSITEGEVVFIHAVVSNDSDTGVSAEVTFSDGDTKLGTVPAELDAGEAATVSFSWQPAAGSHKVTAEFKSKSGTASEKQSATVVVAEKPKPVEVFTETIQPTESAAAIQSSADILNMINSYSPFTASALKPVFAFFDSARTTGAAALDRQITSAKEKIDKTPKPGLVAGSETGDEGSSAQNTFFFVLYTLYLYLLTIIRFLLSNAGIFYPVLVIIFFLFLWKVLRRIRRPA